MSQPDSELVALAVSIGDQRAFGELVRRYQSPVRRWLRQLTGNDADADDLAQDTFVKAWDKLASFSGQGKFSAWLMKLAYNEFLQAVRKHDRRQRLSERYRKDVERHSANTPGPGEEECSELPDLPKLLAVLSEEELDVMLLGYGCGFSHGEISEITGLALGTVKSHVHRGKQRIREHFRLEESP